MLVSLGFWVVGLGTGLRGWLLTDSDLGIVAHAQGFGDLAFVWWVPASILLLVGVVMALGTSLLARMVDESSGEEVKPATRRLESEPGV